MSIVEPERSLACECGNPACPGGVPVQAPFWIQIEPITPDLEGALVYLSVRTTSWEYDGERTDLHDVLSLLWAAALRVHEVASTQLVTVLNAFSGIKTEIYARLLVLEQPGTLADAKTLRAAAEILSVESLAIHALLQDAFGIDVTAGAPREPIAWAPEPAWMAMVRRRYRLRKHYAHEVRFRRAPEWAYLGSNSRGICAVELSAHTVLASERAWPSEYRLSQARIVNSFAPAIC